MRFHFMLVLFALLAVALPAAADATLPGASQHPPAVPQVCPAPASGFNLAQIAQTECCKGKKGICGCRAGKIVCCDGSASTHPGCTCHGDEGVGN